MLHQYLDSEGTKADLSEEESRVFEQLLNLMRSFEIDNEDIENLITSHPFLAHAIHRDNGFSALNFAADIPTTKGLFCFTLFLEKGAALNLELIKQIKHSSINSHKKDFLKIAYKYATAELKIEIDPTQALYDQQFLKTSSTIIIPENSDEYKPIVVKKSGCSCTISIIDNIIYDNELLNHPKIQKILEVAKQKSMTDELLNLSKDKDIADAIVNAITETKNQMFAELFFNSVEDEQVLAEINSQLEDLSIESVLDILLNSAPMDASSRAEAPEASIPSPSSRAEAPEAAGDRGSSSDIPDDTENTISLAEAYKFIKNSIEAFIDAAKILEILSIMAQTSDNQFFGGFHGGNPDDDFGGGNGGSGVVYDNNLKQSNETDILLPVGNFTFNLMTMME